MKKFRKLSSVLMAILLLFAMVTPAGSVGIDLDETIHTGGMNDLNVRQAARDYMDIRAAYLLGETETMEWIIAGVANNEADHKTRLEECSIILIDLSYEIVLVECGGTESLVKVSETVEYIKNGIADSGTVLHELCILCNDMPFVASDAYFEAFSNFRSRSYVSPEEQEYSLNSIPNLDDQLCIIAVAYSQINQGENANGETEYGAAYGDADMEWCSAFICWCAKQANVRTTKKDDTIIYDDPTCQYCLNHYILKGQFYKSYEYGGTYVPKPGDIMFKGSRSYNEDTGEESFTSHHVGLVVSVNEEAETFKIIHMKNNDWKDRLNVVYSTNPAYNYETIEDDTTETLPKNQQKLRISIEKKGRGGKTVTLIKGFVGKEDDLKELGKLLKTKCGVGGSAKDNEIIIQGDFRQRIIELLKAEGYTQTK